MNGRHIRWLILITVIAFCTFEYVYIPFFCPKYGVALPLWQHQPKVILLHSIYMISPSLAKSVEMVLFWIFGLGIWLGFREISSLNVLNHKARKKIFLFIRDHPGFHFRQLEREMGINRGTLTYHLDMLVQERKLVTVRSPGYIRYFENSGRYSPFEKKILSSLNSDRKCAIIHILMASPALMDDIKRRLDLSGSAVTWHLNRMSLDDIVQSRRTGKNITYELSVEASAFLQKNLFFPHRTSGLT
jgi:predicted transcriptional regulator